jgi:hypothetical protein
MQEPKMDATRREQILSYKIDATVTVREAGGVQFATWCLVKINNLAFFNQDVQKISALGKGYPGKTMEEDLKIDYVETLVRLGVVTL